MRRVKIIAAISALTLLFGMQVNAADEEEQRGFLQVGEYQIVSDGEVIEKMPENLDYDIKTNVLTLNNFYLEDGSEEAVGIYANEMGDDFTIHLEGENTLDMHMLKPYEGIIDSSWDNLTIEGPGTLNILNVPFLGIQCWGNLTIDNCTINITGDPTVIGYFYGINGSVYGETDTIIKNSRMNISNTMPSGSSAANAGIDVQEGNLTVQNSEIDINLKNGNIFGLAAGQTEDYGGRLAVEGSTIRCMTSTDMLNAGNRYNHNMYFYEMVNANNLYYYVQDGDSFLQKTFDETFELNKYMRERYDTNYGSTVISSTPMAEYCSHKWDEGTVITEPSCETTGEMTYTCTTCGETKTEEIAAVGHAWDDWQTIKEAECAENGIRIRACSRCNKTETEEIPQLGHEVIVNVVKEPTCTETGLQEKVCSRCGLVIENETIPATGHDYAWIVEKEATFHEDGVKKGTCNTCGNVISERIPKLSESHEHDFSGREEITKPATCTEEGSKNIYCTEPECGEYITETIPMTDHTPGEWTTVKEASCSENGTEERKCTVCGAVLETRITDMLLHTYDEWTMTEDPTCTEAGVETAICSVCGEETVRGVNPLGHDFAEWKVTKEATCTENGDESSVCTRCGQTDTRVIEASGHLFGDWSITKESTLTSEGERQAVCSVCGEVKSEVIPKLSDIQSAISNENAEPVDNVKNKENSVNDSATKAEDENSVNDPAPKTGDDSSIMAYMIGLIGATGVAIITLKKRK